VPLIIVAGAALAWAGGIGRTTPLGISPFGLCVAVAFIIQWLAFIPAYFLQTERFFDLVGSLTFIVVTTLALAVGPTPDGRSLLLTAVVILWALRLGIFLFGRIRKEGRDARFDEIKPSFSRFLMTWTLQGLWVSLTLAPALAAITANRSENLGVFAICGALIWVAGFVIEVIADEQKRRFRADPANADKFIDTGLWSLSRHPNYFGEIVLWFGVAVIAFPLLEGWQHVTLVSPLFVYILLTRISGIPLLEKRAEARWGGQSDYEAYKKRTRKLVPLR
jgi:steroid 5-alpha reductase family enzyme